MLHISGNIHHMVFIYGTHVENDNISSCFFSFYQNCDFPGCKGSKRATNGLKQEKILSVTLHISGTIHHMIFIYAFMVQMISPGFFFHFIKI